MAFTQRRTKGGGEGKELGSGGPDQRERSFLRRNVNENAKSLFNLAETVSATLSSAESAQVGQGKAQNIHRVESVRVCCSYSRNIFVEG